MLVLYYRRLSLAHYLPDEGRRSANLYRSLVDNITDQKSSQKSKQNKSRQPRTGEVVKSHILSDDEVQFLRRRQVRKSHLLVFFAYDSRHFIHIS